MHIVPDLNKDGKDDIIIEDYGFYPYYYYDAILRGGFPIDTIPAWGLNTQNEGIELDHIVPLGDVNGDGFNDFMTNTFTVPHDIKLWLGGRNLHKVADKTWYGKDCTDGGFGSFFGSVGDINGDGVNDIAIGGLHCPSECEPGTIYIFAGDTSVHADTITSIKKDNIIQPIGYKLNDPYPNPFNPSTIISWQLVIRSIVQIKLFDILGREIGILLNEEREPGNNKIEFNASKYNLTSGVYFLQLEVYDKGKILYKETKKLNYIK
jgi:Secretion system C-terminal sorting domain/FG-GAP repeat